MRRFALPLALFAVVFTLPPAAAQDTTEYRAAMASTVRRAAESVLDSVVSIEVIGAAAAPGEEVERDAPTSGVIVDSQGHVLASSIVVERPSASLLVGLPGGRRYAAEVIAQDHHRDLVLLKVDADEPLRPIDLNARPELRVGQSTIAVGRYGLEGAPAVSTGVLSATERLDGIALQTDARVSPSLYGGPLIDLSGRVLGVLIPAVAEGAAEEATSWYDSGIAFAIPAEVIRAKLDRLRAGEDIRKGLIGIVAKSDDPYADDTTIAAVRTRSPAEEAGLKAGDRVVSVAGRAVSRHQQIEQALGPFDAGESIEIVVERDGQEKQFSIELAKSIPPLQPQRLGVVARQRGSDQGDSEEEPSGEVIVEAVLPGSTADGELQSGDVITRVGQTEIHEVSSLRRLLTTADPQQSFQLRIRRDGTEREISLDPADIAAAAPTALPSQWTGAEASQWQITELQLPEAANEAAVLKPRDEAQGLSRLGLLVLLLEPGDGEPAEALQAWTAAAAHNGVVVCAVAPESDERWQPREIEILSRLAAAALKQAPIEPSAVAVASAGVSSGGRAGAADSMALAASVAAQRQFFGAAVSAQTRPVAMRLRSNDPSASLQILLPVDSEDELPSWAAPMQQAGYPIVLGGALGRTDLLIWVRAIQVI